MHDLELLENLGIMIVTALAMTLVLRKINVPSIVIYILCGLTLGPVTGLIDISATVEGEHGALEVISEVGIVLLLFLVGLELSLEKIKDLGKVALVAGLGQIGFTAAGGFGLAMLLGFDVGEAAAIAIALTFSSTVVVVKLLDQKGDLDSLYGRIAVGIFLVQDLVVVLLMTIIVGLGDGASASASELALGLAKAFGGTLVLLVVALGSARYVLPTVFEWAARIPRTLFIFSLAWCFVFVSGAEVLELSPEIGAFLAGMSLAQLRCSHDLRRRVRPLMNFFIAIFFISLGAQMELGAAVDYGWAALLFSIFVLLGKSIGFMWIITRAGYGQRTSFMTSITVAQISEFSFIFAAMVLDVGWIDTAVLSLVMLVGLITMGVSSYMILWGESLYTFVNNRGWLDIFGADADKEPEEIEPLEGHIIVVGLESMGRGIAKHLADRGETVLGIELDPTRAGDVDFDVLIGNIDYASLVEEANLSKARLVVSTVRGEDSNSLLAWRCHQLGIPAAIHAFDPAVVRQLKELDVAHLIEAKELSMRRTVASMQEGGVLA